MRGQSQVKRDFLKRWAKGLKIYRNRNKDMSLLERKNAIKFSADVAMASTKLNTTHWSRALISDATKFNHTTNIVVQHILGHNNFKNVVNFSQSSRSSSSSSTMCVVNYDKKVPSRQLLRRSSGFTRVEKTKTPKVLASVIAKRMVKRRTQRLKSLVPGGEAMDDVSIIKEAVDYMISLHLQVNLMRQLVKVTES